MNTKLETKRGWSLITDAFRAWEVEYIFSVPGESSTPVARAAEEAGIPVISARHEQAAAFMAEAYGRMTKKPGVILVTFGPGFTNTVSSMVNARLSNSPVILIAGAHAPKSHDKLGLQDMRQEPIIESVVKKSIICRKAERIPEYIDMAFRHAIHGRPGPVFLELPIDVLDAPVDFQSVPRLKTSVKSRPVDAVEAKAMMEMIGESTKPMLVAGSGAYYSGAGTALREFVEKTGIPVFTIKFGRGIVPDTHPLCFEAANALRPGCAGLATFNSDCIVLLGNRIDMYSACGIFFRKEQKLIQVDIEPEEMGRNNSIDLAICSDIRVLVEECIRIVDKEKIGNSLTKQFSGWVSELRENEKNSKEMGRTDTHSDALPINPGRLAREIDDFLDREDDIVVADGGDTMSWVLTTRTCRAEWNEIMSGLYGCLGMGIPYGLAAKLVKPSSRVLCFMGDGSMGFNFMEVETSIRKNLPIVIVVCNNNLWGMTANSMKARFQHYIPGTVEIGFVPYHKAVEALGGKGMLVEKPEEIRPALEEAFASGKTTCINVVTDPNVIGPGSKAMAMFEEKIVE
ncbi:MAG: thiamine pyrophosphate-binding protein [Spirochaetes bacterium]|nr:thiamine pyrophosphate-binding protein [Spirochaetota bacterium]